MEALGTLLEAHGYPLLFAVGMLEFAGLPIASGAFLIVAGAFAAHGSLELSVAAVSAASGGLVADAGWYALSRRHGGRVVSVACGLATIPTACVLSVQARVARFGVRTLLFGKIVPGMGNLTAPAAGLAGVPPLKFLLADAIGLLLWALVGILLGWIFADQVEAVVVWLAASTRVVFGVAATLVALAAMVRIVKVRRHRAMHLAELLGNPVEGSAEPATS